MTAIAPGGLLRTIVGILDTIGVPHMVVGSFASSVHGEPRTTRDLDLVIDPTREQLDQLLAALDPDQYFEDVAGIVRIRGAELDLAYVQRWVDEMGVAELWERTKLLAD